MFTGKLEKWELESIVRAGDVLLEITLHDLAHLRDAGVILLYALQENHFVRRNTTSILLGRPLVLDDRTDRS
jgi:hypothetical protein